MSFEEAAALDPEEHGGELEAGRWVPVRRNTWSHGEIVLSVGAILRSFARAKGGWSVSVGDPGTKLEREPDTLRGPDVAVIRVDRRPTGRGAGGWLEGAPDLAVEIMGDTQNVSELTAKALEYLGGGARAVWVIDPEPRRVMVFTPPDHVRVLGADETLAGGEALPGFECRVAELFEI